MDGKSYKIIIGLLLLSTRGALGQVTLRCSAEEFPPKLTIIISNATSRVLKLWNPNNSWGWMNFELEIGEATNRITIRRRVYDWPINTPSFYELKAKATKTVVLRVDDGHWDLPVGLSFTNRVPVTVRYTIKKTPRSEQYGVLTGDFSCECQR
jgi:hypothetical protein